MTQTKKYSDAVVAEAARLSGINENAVRIWIEFGSGAVIALCDLLAERMPDEPSEPEVDPVLAEARERLAVAADAGKYSATAEGYRVGNFDTYHDTLVAIDLIIERYVLQAELDALRAVQP